MKWLEILGANIVRKQWAASDAARDAGIEPAKNIRIISDIAYTSSDNKEDEVCHLTDIYFPIEKETEKYPVIVSIHGGGWFYGDKELYSLYTKYLASKGFAVINFNYRKCPEHKYPDTFVDVVLLMDYLAKNAEKYELDLDRLYMVGDSAGAQLVHQYCVYATNAEYRKLFSDLEAISPVPNKVALNCGIYDRNEKKDKQSCIWYLPKKIIDNTRKSFFNILDYMNADFPKSYLVVSVNDPLMERSQVLKDKFDELGINYIYREFGKEDIKDAHVFHLNMRSADGNRCNQEEIDFFNRG